MKTLLLPTLALISSCSLNGKFENQVDLVNKDYNQELNKQINKTQTGHYEADWAKAKQDLFLKNPRVQRSYFQIEDSIQQKLSVWKNMIPSLNASLSDSATIANFSDLFVDTNFRISSFISLGNLIDMPKRIAVLNLSHIGKELQAEQTMRNEIISLYRTFREQELLDLEAKALRWELDFLEETTTDESSIDFILAKERLTEKKLAFEKKMQAWHSKVSDTLVTEYSSVRLKSAGLPHIYYEGTNLDFSDSKRWGTLQMNLLALQLMANNSQLSVAYKRYFPTPYLGVSAPPLYSSSGNQEFKLSEFRLSPTVNWSIDTKGSIGSQIRRIKREQPFKKWEQDKRLASEVSKLLEGKKALIKVQKEIRDNKNLTNEYRSLVESGLVSDFQSALQRMQSFKAKEISLRAAEVDICTQLWLIDEKRWEETTRQWKQARIAQKKAQKKTLFQKLKGIQIK